VKEIGEVSFVHSSKQQKLTDFLKAVAVYRYTGTPGISIRQYQPIASWKAMKAQQ